jgi:outer membrane protein OmpA-like peptidoglycan-associated protein
MRRITALTLLIALAGCMSPASAPRDFVVFFETDKATLTPEAKIVVVQMAHAAQTAASAKITVEGRADGGTAHDAALADERAAVVMRALVDSGIDATRIAKQPSAPPTGTTGTAAHQVIVQFLP